MTRRELLLYIAAGIGMFTTYFMTTRLVSAPVEVAMPPWVPFLPILTLPYLLQVVVSYVLMMCLRTAPLRQAVFKAYLLTMTATFLIWVTLPTTMPRPSAPDGWWNWPYAVMAGADLPVHVFPAGHVQMPVLICWAFWFDRPQSLRWLLPAQLVATVGIATTWQHRPVDILVGALMALAAGAVFGVSRHGLNATRAAR
ncbi:MAG: hypothetical protein FJ363_05405 [Gemmatimonadetes bacterium]|nr:hypothetical protein [Gemmatimonadota bacterium]